ncbi:hypothetical protein MKZ38_010719 [Zalerion maritima]|uniref:Uncharacterized protein n=1 Tax=Zalerion maritima TaxID=339359 RepID=A0AAD5WN80_9PEZI|nr:hypothetical protein MKZ38_010719 [Zalerion maritima]
MTAAAAVLPLTPLPIAGLHEIVDNIQRLIEIFGVQNKFCFHLLHGHAELEQGTVMHGQKMSGLEACWVRPMPIDRVDPSNMHGHIFVLDPATRSFRPYEFREGAPAPMTDKDNAFVMAFQLYLSSHDLANKLGLEVVPQARMAEFIFGRNFGTVVMKYEHTKAHKSGQAPEGRTTAWAAGANELKGNVVSHEPSINNGPHIMMRDSKLKPWEEGEKFVLDALHEHDLIE